MKNILSVIVLLAIIVSCSKDDTTERIELDDQLINDYLNDNNISATKDESGVYYIITKEGTGGHPNLSHTVLVDYKGYLTDGTVFDESTNAVEFQLSQVIVGFQIGINLLRPGGSGTFYIPSQLGYGDKQVGDIPPNSILIFEVDLVEFY